MSKKTEETIAYIQELKQEAEDATRDRRNAADELWNLYQNKQDYSKKKSWQSKVFVPKVFMAVEQATSIVKRAVISPRKLFKLEAKDPKDIEAKKARKEVERIFKRALSNSNFAIAYAEVIKEAFLVGLGVPKVLWENGLKYVNSSTSKTYIDPDYQQGDVSPKYVIEEKEMDLATLKLMAKKINADSDKNIYNMAEINKIQEDQRDIEHEMEERKRRGISDHNKTDKRVLITEFWGDIVDKNTNKIKENQLVLIANEKYIIRQQDNPFEHGFNPYVPTTPISYPHRGAWGVSLVEPVAKMQYAYNNIINLSLDNLNFSVNKMFEYQPSMLVNPRSMTQVYPGKMVAKSTQGRAIEEIRTSGVGQDSFVTMDLLQGEIQKGTAVTEFLMGTSGKSKTATEAELKTAQAQGLFDTIARDIEATSLTKIIEMSFDLLIQFEVIPEQYRGRYKFSVGGLSLLLVRREQTERMQQVLAMALQNETLASLTNIPELWTKYLSILNLDDIIAETPRGPTPEQRDKMGERAREEAKKKVAGMSEDEIRNYRG